MAQITLHSPFDTRMFTLTSGSPVTAVFGGGDSVILGLANGFELEFIGTGLTMNGLLPAGGSVTRINAYLVVNGVSTLVAELVNRPSFFEPAWTFSLTGLSGGLDGRANQFWGAEGGFSRIIGGASNDAHQNNHAEEIVSLRGGSDTLSFVATPAGQPGPSVQYFGGAGLDWVHFSDPGNSVDLRNVTLSSVEGLNAQGGTMIFASSQIGAANGLGGITQVVGAPNAIIRIVQNTAVADLGSFSGAVVPQWVLVGRAVDDQQVGSNTLALTMRGMGGNDLIRGRGAAERLEGGLGNDSLSGGNGRDDLRGGFGADLLTGGRENDFQTGGAGRDTFVFAQGCQVDTITDFSAFGPERDRIDLRGVTSVTGFADLTENHLAVQGGDILLQLGNGDSILLKAVVRADLDATDFIFAT